MIRRLLRYVFAVSVVAGAVSCNTPERAKTTGPSVAANSNSASTSGVPLWTAVDLASMLEDRKEMQRAWTNFERSQKYRLAQPGETRYSPFRMWSEAEAYQGDELLIAIVVDPSRTDSNRYGLVVIGAPESNGRKYKAYWVEREKDLANCEISGLSGNVFFDCVRADGTKENQELAWFRSRRRFELKDPY